MYQLTEQQLLDDLYTAFFDAKRHKAKKPYVQRFERNIKKNLQQLAHELYTHTYKARASTCFIINDPKKREVFAAAFRDRIVHHLYFNYTHQMFERTFIQDSYSCIKQRGTHYGINRLEQHIRQESLNYQECCYVLKMDIRGYFMHIDRQLLLSICLDTLRKMRTHRINKTSNERWQDVVDLDFVEYLTRVIVLLNPIEDCRFEGSRSDWDDLPHDKSLFHSPQGCGLPIGNLTSQLYSNVYLNVLDQFMKRELHCEHYGRYVDDFYVVSADREWLRTLIPQVRAFLKDKLHLTLHEGKVAILPMQYGVPFLGMYLKPWRRTVLNSCLTRMQRKYSNLVAQHDANLIPIMRLSTSLASFRGILSHGSNKRHQFGAPIILAG